MTRTFTTRMTAASLVFACGVAALAAPVPKKPKLILSIVVDQFRYDYLLRFRGDYTSGLKRLLDQGAVFDDAHYVHFPTVTAVGTSTVLTGATPAVSGIIENTWFDRTIGKNVTSVTDADVKLIGGNPGAAGFSPRRLAVTSLGDEIKRHEPGVKVVGISTKDRSAILLPGHMSDGAWWFDPDTHRWVTSTYYAQELPAWVVEENVAWPVSRTENAKWMPLNAKPGDKPFCIMGKAQPDLRSCGVVEGTPWGNEMTEEMAERALAAEKMGHHDGTDILTVSFSANDYVGHLLGPDAPEVRDISLRVDRLLGKLLDSVDKQIGLANVVVVLTADHGVAPVPEVNQQRNLPGGRVPGATIIAAVQQALESKYGTGKWVVSDYGSGMLYLSRELTMKYKVSAEEASRTAAEAARSVPHVFRVYTAEELRNGRGAGDAITAALINSYFGSRSGDLYVLLDPYFLSIAAPNTTHGTLFDYDTHVPVIFFGAGIRPAHYFQKIAVNDIAPTLAAIAGVPAPSGSFGRVLQEMWQ